MSIKAISINVAVAALLASTSAFAQAADSEASGAGNGDIVVTAQRRAERLQDVPIAVTAMTAEDLSTRQINNTLDLVNYVPNLIGHENTSVGTANAYALRGLANTESIATFDPPVGTYIDDIYISRQNANNFSFFDIDRIEVLRGPQGTLFGRNTIGGAINVILKKPSDHVTGYIDAGYGRFDRKQVRASVDLPVTEKLLTKISGYYTQADGYVDNLTTGEKLNGEKSWGVRGAIRALLSDDVTWDIAADYTWSSQANFPNFYDKQTDRRISFTPLRSDTPIGANLVSAGLADNTLGNVAKGYSFTSNLEVRLDNASISFITGYRHLYQEYMTDSFAGLNSTSLVLDGLDFVSASRGSATPLVNDSWNKQFSQEIKIAGKALNDKLDYVGGFYYINEKNDTNFANITLPLTGAATVSGDRLMSNDTEAFAGYFQGDYHITPELTFTAGIRYTDETKTIAFTPNASPLARSAAINQPFDTNDLVRAGIPVKMQSKVWTPRFALNYKFNDDLMIFASATRGFKSGGWNSRAYYATGAVAFGPEKIWSYEGGLRSEWFDRMLKVNLTGFYYIDRNQQLSGGGFDPTTGTITYLTRNVADMENYGLEAEVTLKPMQGLNLFWNGGYQKARFLNINATTLQQQQTCLTTKLSCNAGIVTPTGQLAVPTRAPKFTSTLGASYEIPLSSKYTLTPSANWRYTSSTWISTSNDPRGFQGGYSLFNGGVTLASSDGWSLGVECSNCFDKTYRTSFLIYAYLNNPGTWLVRAGYKF